jgi:hypothetical protein
MRLREKNQIKATTELDASNNDQAMPVGRMQIEFRGGCARGDPKQTSERAIHLILLMSSRSAS